MHVDLYKRGSHTRPGSVEHYGHLGTECRKTNTIMKGTKVLTLGAGREILPHNTAVTKM